MIAIIFDNCPDFKMYLNNHIITKKNMTFRKALDEVDKLGIAKKDIYIYNKNMERVYL